MIIIKLQKYENNRFKPNYLYIFNILEVLFICLSYPFILY